MTAAITLDMLHSAPSADFPVLDLGPYIGGEEAALGGDAVMVTPPLIIGPPEVEYIVQNLRSALDEVRLQL